MSLSSLKTSGVRPRRPSGSRLLQHIPVLGHVDDAPVVAPVAVGLALPWVAPRGPGLLAHSGTSVEDPCCFTHGPDLPGRVERDEETSQDLSEPRRSGPDPRTVPTFLHRGRSETQDRGDTGVSSESLLSLDYSPLDCRVRRKTILRSGWWRGPQSLRPSLSLTPNLRLDFSTVYCYMKVCDPGTNFEHLLSVEIF